MAEIIADQHVSIGSWVFGTACCILEDGSGVYAAPSVRGADRTVPGVAGDVVRPRTRGPIRFPLVAIVLGDVDPDGAPFADPRVGLAANLAAMHAALLPFAGSPVRTLVHGIDGAPFRTAGCIVVAIDGPDDLSRGVVRVSVDVKIPSGALTLVSP